MAKKVAKEQLPFAQAGAMKFHGGIIQLPNTPAPKKGHNVLSRIRTCDPPGGPGYGPASPRFRNYTSRPLYHCFKWYRLDGEMAV